MLTVKILKVASYNFIYGEIRKGKLKEMPSMQTGWQFNFNKHIKLPNSQTYVLVTEETPHIIEGCLVFQMKDKVTPYLAYVEIAPHNKTKSKQHGLVAGCLIAYACQLSFEQGKSHNQGYLTFDVRENNTGNQIKLMMLYSTKYNAVRLGTSTTMLIIPKEGKALIKLYLE